MSKFMARIIIPFEADDEEAAQKQLLEYVRSGIKTNCAIELMHAPDEEEEKKITENVSFQELLNDLNSKDMTKN